MNSRNYTIFNVKSILDFNDLDYTEDAMEFLKNPDNFRSFAEGLTELLKRKGYPKSLDHACEMADYLYQKLKGIGSLTTYETVESWFLGTHQPKIEFGYRRQIYEICFAMQLSLNETKWFFQHVYYDRAFNCHTVEESVFYFALKKSLSYPQALQIINIVAGTPAPSFADSEPNYTQFIQQQLSDLKSTDELIAFLVHNKNNFEQWNQSAFQKLQALFHELIPSPDGKKEIDNMKRTIIRKNSVYHVIPPLAEKSHWGLIMQEFFSQISSVEDLDQINKKNICSITFVLERILYTSAGLPKKKTQLPYVVCNNFPSKKTMSDVLSQSKMERLKSYDSIRKMIILLYFYNYWVRVKLHYIDYEPAQLYEIFKDETNSILYQCGYEELYAGNPYDWLFLCAAQAKDPLEYLRSCLLTLLPDDDL